MSNENFSVMDMVQTNNDLDNVLNSKPSEPVVDDQPKPRKKEKWVPDQETLESMPELKNKPLTYSKDELITSSDGPKKNLSDDVAIQASRESMDIMSRKLANIEDAKREMGIKHLLIPEGQFHVMIHNSAGDTNYRRSIEGIKEAINAAIEVDPNVVEWLESSKNEQLPPVADIAVDDESYDNNEEYVSQDNNSENDNVVEIRVDKDVIDQISWDKDVVEKVKKYRTIEINIEENLDLQYTELEDVDDNMVDNVLSEYTRSYNDSVGSLPGSRYRATFTGLSYGEVMDLSYSSGLNSLDEELKKWTLAFNHITNQSIGKWQSYKWYIDPVTNKKKVVNIDADLSRVNIHPSMIHVVSEFEDFLMKTSYMDLNYILYKILCASSLENELITINCKAINRNTRKLCGSFHEWIYSPVDLLKADRISEVVLDEMTVTANAMDASEIESNYSESLVSKNRIIELPTSGIAVVFGHISAHEYLNTTYATLEELKKVVDAIPEPVDDDEEKPITSESIIISVLTAIKAFIIKKDGVNKRISGSDNIAKVIRTLDEIDIRVLLEISAMVTTPYAFQYQLSDIVCPTCKSKSSIPIVNLASLLFIVAQSLSNVRVTLKKD